MVEIAYDRGKERTDRFVFLFDRRVTRRRLLNQQYPDAEKNCRRRKH